MNAATGVRSACGMPGDQYAVLMDRAGRILDAFIDGPQPVTARFGAETVNIPTPALSLLREILNHMAHGNAVAVTALHAELTTRQAADLLQVSRTHLLQFLEEGRIPFRKVGSHRRVRAEDILAYRNETELRRRKALDHLTARDQELGLQ